MDVSRFFFLMCKHWQQILKFYSIEVEHIQIQQYSAASTCTLFLPHDKKILNLRPIQPPP